MAATDGDGVCGHRRRAQVIVRTLATGSGLSDLLAQPFMVNALLAGVPVAALAGIVGYFMVLRSQVFTGDALSHVAFTGAVTALAFGVDVRLGLFAATIAVAAGLGLLGGLGRPDDVAIGTVFTWVLGLGVLALSVYISSGSGASDGAAGANVLFGSIFGLSRSAAAAAAGIAVVLIVLMLLLGRPLLFASLDEAVALARGVPVRAVGVAFLLVVGATAADATPAVGALLLLGLLAAPAGAAHRLTARPYRAIPLSALLSVCAMVVGLTVSYVLPTVPPSFAIISIGTLTYAATFLLHLRSAPRPPRRRPAHEGRASRRWSADT
jgi:zinc/manganese transport system permease protein